MMQLLLVENRKFLYGFNSWAFELKIDTHQRTSSESISYTFL